MHIWTNKSNFELVGQNSLKTLAKKFRRRSIFGRLLEKKKTHFDSF